MPPFFSVITATRNAAKPLPTLLDSLAAQTCRDFELVIQDGLSTDLTLLLVQSRARDLPALALRSEPDSGIYDAWNRAVARSSGRWLIFLGADDSLAGPDVFARARAALFGQPEGLRFAAGAGRLVLADGTVHAELGVDLARSREFFEVGCPVCHPALFYNRALFAEDRFDTSYKVVADYDFLLRHWDAERIAPLPFVVSEMLAGGVSTAAASRWLTVRETLIVAKKRLGYYPRPLLILGGKALLHFCLTRLLGRKRANAAYDLLRRLNGREPYWSDHG